MTCMNCLHFDVCASSVKKIYTPSDDMYFHIEKVCLSFMDKPSITGDLVQVVRCSNCKSYDSESVKGHYGKCKRYNRIFADYDYCSMAQERDSVRH